MLNRSVKKSEGEIRLMKILAIESSCDESAAAIFDSSAGVLESLIHSQIDLHALYGGVVPDLASSEHLKKLPALIAKISKSPHFKDIDFIAATSGPGLPNCLARGVSAAAALAANMAAAIRRNTSRTAYSRLINSRRNRGLAPIEVCFAFGSAYREAYDSFELDE